MHSDSPRFSAFQCELLDKMLDRSFNNFPVYFLDLPAPLRPRPCLLSSAEKQIASGVRDVVIGIHSGVTLDRNVEGDIGLATHHDLESQVPNNVKQELDAVVAGLIDGSIAIGVNF